MNPYVLLALLVAFGGSVGGAYLKGRSDGKSIEAASRISDEELAKKVQEQAQIGAANAISKIEIKQVTIQGRLQKEIQTNTVYRECQHSPDGLRALNEALTNGTGSVGDSKLPASSPSR